MTTASVGPGLRVMVHIGLCGDVRYGDATFQPHARRLDFHKNAEVHVELCRERVQPVPELGRVDLRGEFRAFSLKTLPADGSLMPSRACTSAHLGMAMFNEVELRKANSSTSAILLCKHRVSDTPLSSAGSA